MSFIFRQAPLSSTSESFKITSSLFLSRATLCWSKAWGRWLIVCRHLEFDGQLKLALHQPRFSGTQRIAIKFRNFVNFYDLNLSSVQSEISLKHIRTLRITRWVNWLVNNMFIIHWKFFHTYIGNSTMDDIYLSVDGRETRLDDNPSQELRRQFGELQKRVRALNNYTRFAIIAM